MFEKYLLLYVLFKTMNHFPNYPVESIDLQTIHTFTLILTPVINNTYRDDRVYCNYI